MHSLQSLTGVLDCKPGEASVSPAPSAPTLVPALFPGAAQAAAFFVPGQAGGAKMWWKRGRRRQALWAPGTQTAAGRGVAGPPPRGLLGVAPRCVGAWGPSSRAAVLVATGCVGLPEEEFGFPT